jgi:hypothetical protein
MLSWEETMADRVRGSLEEIKKMIFFDDEGFRYTLFRVTKVVTVIGNRHKMQIGDEVTIFRYTQESPIEKLSYIVRVTKTNQHKGIMELQSSVELCPCLVLPALYHPVPAQEYFQARLPEGAKVPCFEKGVISKCDISVQLGSSHCDMDGAVGCGLYATNEHSLIGICVRYETDVEGHASGSSGSSKSSSYTTHIAPVFSFH